MEERSYRFAGYEVRIYPVCNNKWGYAANNYAGASHYGSGYSDPSEAAAAANQKIADARREGNYVRAK